jgi:hypothetical protein
VCQDSDYDEKEENATAITKVEPDPRSPKETVEKNLFKGTVKVNRELAIIIPEQGGRDLLDVIKEVDDLFLKAADSAETVSNILETRKVHYHSSFCSGVGLQFFASYLVLSLIFLFSFSQFFNLPLVVFYQL